MKKLFLNAQEKGKEIKLIRNDSYSGSYKYVDDGETKYKLKTLRKHIGPMG